jgi:hypothetical protein
MNYELSDASCHEFFTTARLSRKPDLRRDQTCALRRELYMIDPLLSSKSRFRPAFAWGFIESRTGFLVIPQEDPQ